MTTMEVKSSHWKLDDKWIDSHDRRTLLDSLYARISVSSSSTSSLSLTSVSSLGIIDDKKPKTDYQLASYKIGVLGKSAVGKTCTVLSLTGRSPSHKYVETCGVQVFDIIWPIKIEDQSRVWLVTLELWDAAATNMKANDITSHAIMDDADAFLHICSAIDSKSLTELLPSLTDNIDLLPQAVLMTKCDEWSKRQISDVELRQSVGGIASSSSSSILTCSIANLPVPSSPFYVRHEITSLLTNLTLLLLQRRPPTKR